MKKLPAIFLVNFLLAVSFVFGQEDSGLSFSGELKFRAGAYSPWTEKAGDLSDASGSLKLEAEGWYEKASIFVSGIAVCDKIFVRAYNQTEKNILSNPEGNFYLNLKEAYADYSDDHWGFRVGRQIAAWEKADMVQITDVLCPKDYTSLFASDYASSRVGIDAVRLSVYGDFFNVDAYWIPFFTPSPLPLTKENPLNTLLFSGMDSASAASFDFESPELKLYNSSFGARAAFSFSALDFAAYFYYGFDSQPVTSFLMNTFNAVNVTALYKRQILAGIDAAIPLGSFVLRAEAAWVKKYFSCNAKDVLLGGAEPFIEKNQIKALVGFDYNQAGWTITAQYFEFFIIDHTASIKDDWHQDGITLSVSKSLLRDTLSLSLQGILNFTHLDSAVIFGAEYALTDSLKVNVEVTQFSPGRGDGEYGAYKDLSSIALGASYKF